MLSTTKRTDGNTDSDNALTQMATGEITLLMNKMRECGKNQKQPKVEDMRRVIPLLLAFCFDRKDHILSKKSKQKWTNAPNDWPACIPFCDPNNSKQRDGTSNVKPKKETLAKMLVFLLEKYQEMNGTAGQQALDDHDDYAVEGDVVEEHSYTKTSTIYNTCDSNAADREFQLDSPPNHVVESKRYECSKSDYSLEPSHDKCNSFEVDDDDNDEKQYDEDYDPVEESMTRVKAKVRLLDRKRGVPDEHLGLLYTIKGLLEKLCQLSKDNLTRAYLIERAHEFESTIDVAKITKSVPNLQVGKWKLFIGEIGIEELDEDKLRAIVIDKKVNPNSVEDETNDAATKKIKLTEMITFNSGAAEDGVSLSKSSSQPRLLDSFIKDIPKVSDSEISCVKVESKWPINGIGPCQRKSMQSETGSTNLEASSSSFDSQFQSLYYGVVVNEIGNYEQLQKAVKEIADETPDQQFTNVESPRCYPPGPTPLFQSTYDAKHSFIECAQNVEAARDSALGYVGASENSAIGLIKDEQVCSNDEEGYISMLPSNPNRNDDDILASLIATELGDISDLHRNSVSDCGHFGQSVDITSHLSIKTQQLSIHSDGNNSPIPNISLADFHCPHYANKSFPVQETHVSAHPSVELDQVCLSWSCILGTQAEARPTEAATTGDVVNNPGKRKCTDIERPNVSTASYLPQLTFSGGKQLLTGPCAASIPTVVEHLENLNEEPLFDRPRKRKRNEY